MKKQTLKPLVIGFIIFVILTILFGCSTKKAIIQEKEYIHDSITIVDSTRTIFVPESVKITIPATTQETIRKDTASFLHNKYFASKAYWDGLYLHHSLYSLPNAEVHGTILTPQTTKIRKINNTITKTKSKTRTIFIKPKMTLFQRFQLWSWWLFLLVSIYAIIDFIRKRQ